MVLEVLPIYAQIRKSNSYTTQDSISQIETDVVDIPSLIEKFKLAYKEEGAGNHVYELSSFITKL